MMGNSRVEVSGDRVCFGGGAPSRMGRCWSSGGMNLWPCGDSCLFFWVTQGKAPHPQVLLLPPCCTPKTHLPQTRSQRGFVIPLGAPFSSQCSNLPAYSSVMTVSLVTGFIFFSLTEVAQYCHMTLKMGNKALFHNINVMRKKLLRWILCIPNKKRLPENNTTRACTCW